MAMWRFSPTEKIPQRNADAMRTHMRCPECGSGELMRLAVRELFQPWHWIVAGFTCTICYAVWTEGPSRV